MADQHHAAATRHEAPDETQQLLGHPGVQRRGGLVENHQFQALIHLDKSTGNLNHLPLANRQLGDDVVGCNTMAGKISSRLASISALACRRQPQPRIAGDISRRFSATLRFGHKDSS
jgi:hypothetical protein